MALLTN